VTPSLVLNSFVPVVVDDDDAEPLTNIDHRIFLFFFFFKVNEDDDEDEEEEEASLLSETERELKEEEEEAKKGARARPFMMMPCVVFLSREEVSPERELSRNEAKRLKP